MNGKVPLFRRIVTGLEYVGKLAIVATAVSYLLNHDAQMRAQRDQAWDKITAGEWSERPGNRAAALEILVLQGVNLSGVPLGPVNFLPGLNLSGCLTVWGYNIPLTCRDSRLEGIHLEWARLPGASFRQANLQNAHFTGAWLVPGDVGGNYDPQSTDFSHAHLELAHLDQAHVERAKFNGASMVSTVLDGAWITGADFTDTDITAAQLDSACFDEPAPTLPATLGSYDIKRPNPRSCAGTRIPYWLEKYS